MVRALLEGRKTMTRRLALSSKSKRDPATGYAIGGSIKASPWQKMQPGDRLWVRETWCPANTDDGPALLTKADLDRRYLVHESSPVDYDIYPAGRSAWSAWAVDVESGSTKDWRSPIHMPRWASRLTLIVTATKIERVQDISEADATAEGAQLRWLKAANCAPRPHYFIDVGDSIEHSGGCACEAFERLWDALHGPASWDANPEVVALTFTVHKQNIDAMAKAEAA